MITRQEALELMLAVAKANTAQIRGMMGSLEPVPDPTPTPDPTPIPNPPPRPPPKPPSSDLQSILMGQVQPVTGMLSRTGHGEKATGGGTNYAYVSSRDDLKAALKQGGNHVVPTKAMAGAQINFGEPVRWGADTTLNGSLAKGLEFLTGMNYTFLINQSNSVAHNFTMNTTYGNVVNFQGGENHWWDKITLGGGGGSDDGIGFGGSGSSKTANKATFSNWHVEPDAFGTIVLNWYRYAVAEGLIGKVTFHSSHMQAEQRNGKNDGAGQYHEFNNVVDGVRNGNDTYNDNGWKGQKIKRQDNPSIQQRSTSWIDGNRYVNGQTRGKGPRSAMKTREEETMQDAVIFHSNIQMDGSYEMSGNVIGENHPRYEKHPFSYDWIMLPEYEPNSVITDFAGAD